MLLCAVTPCYTGKWHSAWTSLSPEIKSAAFGTAKPICNSSNLNHCHTGHNDTNWEWCLGKLRCVISVGNCPKFESWFCLSPQDCMAWRVFLGGTVAISMWLGLEYKESCWRLFPAFANDLDTLAGVALTQWGRVLHLDFDGSKAGLYLVWVAGYSLEFSS